MDREDLPPSPQAGCPRTVDPGRIRVDHDDNRHPSGLTKTVTYPCSSPIDAENYLRTLTPSAKPNKIGFKPPGGTQRGTAGYRYPDIYDKDAKQAIEVKNGYIRLGKDNFIKKQVEKDAALIAAGGEIRSVTWHFFPNSKGRVGLSDELRQLLQDNQIPYVIHIP